MQCICIKPATAAAAVGNTRWALILSLTGSPSPLPFPVAGRYFSVPHASKGQEWVAEGGSERTHRRGNTLEEQEESKIKTEGRIRVVWKKENPKENIHVLLKFLQYIIERKKGTHDMMT